MKNSDLSFAVIMDSIFIDDKVHIPLLFNLSDMRPEEWDQFEQRWSTVPVERRRIVMRHLADLSEENFEVEYSTVFKLGLADGDAEVRKASLDGLWDTTNVSVITPIIEAMRSDVDASVREAATAALAHFVLLGEWGQIGPQARDRVVNALLESYDAPESDDAVRRAALEALGASGHPRVPAMIIEAYESEDRRLQLSSLFAMGNSADSRWLETVLAEMENPSYEMRAEAARAAGEIGSSAAIAALAELAYDHEEDVQIAAIHAIAKVGGERAAELLDGMLHDQDLEELQAVVEEAIEEIDWLLTDFNLLDIDLEDER